MKETKNLRHLTESINQFISTAHSQEEYGIEKYGKGLDPLDNYDWLNMAQEELVDGFKYLHAERVKRQTAADNIRRLTNDEEILKWVDVLEGKSKVEVPKREEQNFTYLAVLVDCAKDARMINSIFYPWETTGFKIRAFSSMQSTLKLRHQTFLPTHVFDAIQDRSHPKFDDWYQNCVLPNAARAVMNFKE